MERTQALFEKIEGYLAGTLPQEEIVVFEKEIAANTKLKQEVETQRELHRVLKDRDTLAFKEKLQRISKEIKEEERLASTNKYSAFSYWKIAASIVVLLGLGTLLRNHFKDADKVSDLYIAHYAPYPAEDVTRGDTKNDMSDIMKSYSRGEYKEVVSKLEELMKLSNKEQLKLYLGNSYLNIGKEKEAILQFKNVSDTSRYYEDATWYRALTYLKLGKVKKSIPILEEIVSFNGLYKKNASDLIEKLTK